MVEGPVVGAAWATGDERDHLALDAGARALRARWRSASLAAGWRFPSDWALPEIDAVCAALMLDGPSDGAMSGLGRARAAAGAGLEETLVDLAALHAVFVNPDAAAGFGTVGLDEVPTRLVRVTALAWADVALDQLANTEVTDPLTGLPTAAYLRTRLSEVYRRAGRLARPAAEDGVLLTVTIDLSGLGGWPRLTVMILVADVLREVFDGGETVAVLGPSTVAVLTTREVDFATHAVQVRRAINEQVLTDPQLRRLDQPKVRVVRLKPTFAETCAMLADIAHR